MRGRGGAVWVLFPVVRYTRPVLRCGNLILLAVGIGALEENVISMLSIVDGVCCLGSVRRTGVVIDWKLLVNEGWRWLR